MMNQREGRGLGYYHLMHIYEERNLVCRCNMWLLGMFIITLQKKLRNMRGLQKYDSRGSLSLKFMAWFAKAHHTYAGHYVGRTPPTGAEKQISNYSSLGLQQPCLHKVLMHKLSQSMELSKERGMDHPRNRTCICAWMHVMEGTHIYTVNYPNHYLTVWK